MKLNYIALTILGLMTGNAFAQQANDIKTIESLCGCYDVKFTYAETFSPDSNYKFHERETTQARELIIPIEKTDKKIVLQHMLLVGGGHVIKHWREDWVYEAPELLNYTGENTWVKQKVDKKDVAGKWTQTVWQVDDMPRYQGYSAWINNDGKTYWENTAYAPLPRREITVRSDYNIMKRTNRIIPTSYGWLHEQDNDKIIRTAKGDELLAQEKGLNYYTKIDDAKCAVALAKWEASKDFWVVVKKEWSRYIDKQSVLMVKDLVDDEKLYEHLYVVEKEWKEKKLSEKELEKKVKVVFEKFVSTSTASK
jgi:hypothetical protein